MILFDDYGYDLWPVLPICVWTAWHEAQGFVSLAKCGGRRWADAGWHRVDVRTGEGTPDPDVQTPNMDALVKEGIEMDRQCAGLAQCHRHPFGHQPSVRFTRVPYLTVTRRMLTQPQMCISIVLLRALGFRVVATRSTSTPSMLPRIFTIQATQFLASRPFRET